jgi:hypothetical protein
MLGVAAAGSGSSLGPGSSRARISSPCIGWTLGEPLLTRRTWRRPVASSTWCHIRSHSSKARRPCRKASKIMVASRWPQRPDLRASLINRSTSTTVRYRRVLTEEFTVVGAVGWPARFAIVFRHFYDELANLSRQPLRNPVSAAYHHRDPRAGHCRWAQACRRPVGAPP